MPPFIEVRMSDCDASHEMAISYSRWRSACDKQESAKTLMLFMYSLEYAVRRKKRRTIPGTTGL